MGTFGTMDLIFWWGFIVIGSIGGCWNLYDAIKGKGYYDRWYVFVKALQGFNIAIVYFLIWHPKYLDDMWNARQCVRSIVLVSALLLISDAALRHARRKFR